MIFFTRMRVAAALEFSRKEGVDDLLVHVEFNETTGKRDDVRIVVLTAQLGKLHVDDVRSTAANDFVGRERHADARAAYEHAAIGHAPLDVMRNSGCIIRVIDAIVAVAAIDNLSSPLFQIRRELLLLLETCVRTSHGDSHAADNPFFARPCRRYSLLVNHNPRNRRVPVGELFFTLCLTHCRAKVIVALAHGAHFSRALPESRGKPRQKRSSQACAFKHLGTVELGIEDIGLELHQKAVRRCPAIDVELVNRMPRFAFHGRRDIGNLIRHGFECRSGDMRPVRAPRKAENRTTRLGVPIWCAEARERRNHHNARRIGNAVRKVFAFSSVLNNAGVRS